MKAALHVILYAILISCAILIPFATFAEDKQPSLQEKEETARKFQRLFNVAHPQPDSKPVEEARESEIFGIPMIPTALPINFPLFLNINIINTETGSNDEMQNESSIAVCPTNPKFIVSSAVDYRDESATWVYVSTDAGATWVNKNLGRPYTGWQATNDPSVAFDADGTAYLVTGGFGTRSDTLGSSYGENGVFLARSKDGGSSWKAHIPVIVHLMPQTVDSAFEDKYYISVDNSPVSPYFKHLYIPWKRVILKDSSTQIVITKSTNQGDLWTTPVPISYKISGSSDDTTYGQSFPLCITGPDGEVYVVWNNGLEHAVGYVKSVDGGKNFTDPRMIIHYNTMGVTKQLAEGWRHTVKSVVRAESYPSLVCDTRDGQRRGWLYLTWAADSLPNVYFSRSTDGGNNWSSPVVVHSDTTGDQFWQWIAMDPKNGDLAIMYLDSRNDPKNILTQCYVSYSSDGGLTWIDRLVSDTSFDLRKNPFGGSFAGDYSGCAFYDGIIYPSNVDMRHAKANIYDSDVFTGKVNTRVPIPPMDFKARAIPEKLTEIELRWTPPTERAFGHPIAPDKYKYLIFRENALIADLDGTSNRYVDQGLTAHTKYTYKIVPYILSDTGKMVSSSAYAGGGRNPLPAMIVSGFSNESKKIQVNIKLPSLREDGETPFINLSEIYVYRDSALLKQVKLEITDTGKAVTFEDVTPEIGYYTYYVIVGDLSTPQAKSTGSNSYPVYTGDVPTNFIEAFESEKLKKYNNIGGWGTVSTFFHSANFCVNESPSGKYANSKNYELWLYPFKLSTDIVKEISFYHAAIVGLRDTAFFECRYGTNGVWNTLAKYNKNSFPPWLDNQLTDQDWKMETFKFPLASDTVYVRFRLQSSTSSTLDGWFIDDISFSDINPVTDKSSDINLMVYPNPASETINVLFVGDGLLGIQSVSVIDLLGNNVGINIAGDGKYLRIPVSGLASGMYLIRIKLSDGSLHQEKMLISN